MSKLSANFIMYNCVDLDYPYMSAINSCMGVCDDVYVSEGNSTDSTQVGLTHLKVKYGDRLKIFNRDWDHTRAFWATERNFILDQIPEDNFVLNMGADELLHEQDFYRIKAFMADHKEKSALGFDAIHFYGLPDYHIEGKNWAKKLTKLWKNSEGIRYLNRPGGCADDPVWPNGQPVHWVNRVDMGVKVYHYGHCRHPKALGIKNKKADMLYQNSTELRDGSFPEIHEFDYRLEEFIVNGGVKEFVGTHPSFVAHWVDMHKDQETKWRSK